MFRATNFPRQRYQIDVTNLIIEREKNVLGGYHENFKYQSKIHSDLFNIFFLIGNILCKNVFQFVRSNN